MRMDQRQEMTAKDLVNTYSEMELFRIIRDYGEDRFAKNIAKHIVAARKEKPIETTFELNEIIKASIPAKVRATGGHPSKRTYQAIRIELNRELDVLENSMHRQAFCIVALVYLADFLIARILHAVYLVRTQKLHNQSVQILCSRSDYYLVRVHIHTAKR